MLKGQTASNNRDNVPPVGMFDFMKRMVVGGASTLLGTAIEQGAWYPVDTAGTQAQLHHMKVIPWLKQYIKVHGLIRTYGMLNNGLVVTAPKKGFQRFWKYIGQDEIKTLITANFGETANKNFGFYSDVVINGGAGALTGAGEVLAVQPWDRVQKHFQAKQIPFSFSECKKLIKALGLKGLYKAGWLTIGRNSIGSFFHFSIPTLINKSADNQKQQNLIIDFLAKFTGSFFGLVIAQPFDVIKVNMQIKGLSFMEAFMMLTLRQMLTSGLGPRMLLSGKIATGYFGIDYFRRLFSKKADSDTSETKPSSQSGSEIKELTQQLSALKLDTDKSDPSQLYINQYNLFETWIVLTPKNETPVPGQRISHQENRAERSL